MEAQPKGGLKSALELALARLDKGAEPRKSLTPAQKARLAELDREAAAGAAELEIAWDGRIAALRAAGDPEKLTEAEAQKQREIRRVRDRAEQEKERVRHES